MNNNYLLATVFGVLSISAAGDAATLGKSTHHDPNSTSYKIEFVFDSSDVVDFGDGDQITFDQGATAMVTCKDKILTGEIMYDGSDQVLSFQYKNRTHCAAVKDIVTQFEKDSSKGMQFKVNTEQSSKKGALIRKT